MESVEHIAASKTAPHAFVDSVLNPKALNVERVPVDHTGTGRPSGQRGKIKSWIAYPTAQALEICRARR
jgi:hypothetical protein